MGSSARERDDFADAVVASVPRLHRYARSLMYRREDAEDLVGDSVLRALSKRHLFEPGTNLLGWLLCIVHSAAVNGHRRRARRDAIARDYPRPLPPSDPEVQVIAGEVMRAVRALPREKRVLIERIAIGGESYGTLALDEDIPLGTVRSRLARAREELRAVTGR